LHTQIQEGCDVIHSEKFTGTNADRPEFNALLSKLETEDTLVVTKLDRFARSTVDAIQTVKQLSLCLFLSFGGLSDIKKPPLRS
jgi:DNA invertase Pin-like site-specific DNA recombinase